MSCPDWVALTAHRFDRSCEEPSGWSEALVHLDSCPSCRRAAFAVDPTLAFRRPPAPKEVDVESILQGARVLRRASRVRPPRLWREAAAAAALVTVALWVAPSGAPVEDFKISESVPNPYVESLPTVEAVDRPEARIYQLADDELSMVMIIDETLDV